jgi:competence protein ComFC
VGILDFIFPKYCVNCKKLGQYICTDCFSFISFDISMICLVCNRPSFNGLTHPGCEGRYTIDGCFAAVAYKGVVRKLIYSFKYKPFLSGLTNTLVGLFYESIIQNEMFFKTLEKPDNKKVIIVPVPLHRKRLRQRGYNHARLLAKGLAKKLNLEMADALQRTKDTKSQFGLKLKDRKENIKGAFTLAQSSEPRAQSVFLVDDILTSGSTLLEAANTLKRKGAKNVWGLALARD